MFYEQNQGGGVESDIDRGWQRPNAVNEESFHLPQGILGGGGGYK